MTALSNGRRAFWVGLAVISLLYCIYYLGFVYDLFLVLPMRGRHFIKLFFILCVYWTGLRVMRRSTALWVKRLWSFIYLACILLLLLLGLSDWIIIRTPVQLRTVADNLQELLVSPLLYVAIRLIVKYLGGGSSFRA